MENYAKEKNKSRPHLLLIDGHNMVRSIYGGMSGDEDKKKARHAIKSSWGSLHRALKEHAPSHFLTVFDGAGKNWRHDLYPEYKAGRTPMTTYLKDAVDEFKKQMSRTGLRNITTDGFEAEDLINTLAIRAIPRGFDVTALSSDKDMTVLIDKGVRVVNHFGSEVRDAAWMTKRFNIAPGQMTDFLALCGDSTDGIPGVDKIADKTAAKLLAEHGTLERILTAAINPGIKGAVGKNLVEQADRALLSQKLARLHNDVPLDVSPSMLRLQSMQKTLEAIRAAQAQWTFQEKAPAMRRLRF